MRRMAMKRIENKAPDGVIVFNYARSKATLPASDTILTLIPNKAWEALSKGDSDPYFKIEAIDFPANGSGGVYDASFFKSFLNVMKERPIPGSKRGHEYTSRPASDFYTVGGKIDENADKKSGTVYLKIYMPKSGDFTDNAGFIRDAAAGIVNFSLVTAPDYKVVTESDDKGNKIQVRHFIASMGYERNDAVEYGAGAMAQTVNSHNLPFDFDTAKALIEAGQFDRSTNVVGDPIQNDRVYRTALRHLCSRASVEDRSALGELISMIDKSKNGRKTVEDREEAVNLLSNLIANGKDKITDIVKDLGIESSLRNEADEKNAETVKALNAKLGDKPLERLEAILAENKANADATVENAVTAAFGAKEIENVAKEKVPNSLHLRAMELCAGKRGEDLTAAIENAKKDPIMLDIARNRADGNSGFNRILRSESRDGAQTEAGDGIVTHKIGRK
jgi:hypothetical protein